MSDSEKMLLADILNDVNILNKEIEQEVKTEKAAITQTMEDEAHSQVTDFLITDSNNNASLIKKQSKKISRSLQLANIKEQKQLIENYLR